MAVPPVLSFFLESTFNRSDLPETAPGTRPIPLKDSPGSSAGMGQELRNQEFRQEFFSGMGHSRSEPGIPGSGTPEGGTLAGVLVVLAKYPHPA